MQPVQRNRRQVGASRLLVIGSLLLVAVLATAGVMYGPALLDYYRFDKAIQRASQENVATGGPWPQLNESCMPCHGYTGNSQNQFYPSLAGQPADYLRAQLQAFASGQRANPTMSSLAVNLSPAEIETLATFFAARTVVPNSTFKPDSQRVEIGKRLVEEKVCAACHGAELQGQAAFPRLSGQGYDYLVHQLRSFKNGSRKDASGVMSALAAPLTDEDIVNIATYLASNRGTSHAQ